MTAGKSQWRQSKIRDELEAEERKKTIALNDAESRKRQRLAAELKAELDTPLVERPVRG